MRVRLLTLMAGPKGVIAPGTVLDVSDAEAEGLVSGGYAEVVPEEAVSETTEAKAMSDPESQVVEEATADPAPETATGAGQRRRASK